MGAGGRIPGQPGCDLPPLSVQELLISSAALKVLLLTGDEIAKVWHSHCRTGINIPPLLLQKTPGSSVS